ncbi:MAG: hypothetical protein ACD_75C02205G0003 [uncultured bacterium]|nr:MAG: hypothetical protein ACD_75C02205G0003 [uncultured bacterium]
MSRSMKTVHRSLIIGALRFSTRSEYASTGQPNLAACSSINDPVPAAQTLFIVEKVTRPSFRVVNLASWPPISMIVSTSGIS